MRHDSAPAKRGAQIRRYSKFASIEKNAFDFLEAVRFVDSVPALERLFLAYLAPMGVEFAVCAQLTNPGGGLARRAIFGALNHDWFGYYQKHHLFYHDVVIRRAMTSSLPVLWSDIANEDLTKTETLVMEEPRNFGLADGLSIPIHGASRNVAAVTVAGQFFKSDPVVEAAVHMMSVGAYHRGYDLAGSLKEPIQGLRLTQRQLQCLQLLRLGATNEQIAQNLGISPHTARDHLKAVKQSLGVSTNMEAVVRADQANLFRL